MRARLTSSAAFSLLAATAIACSDGTGPDPQDVVDVLLDFCATETPVFFAVQNEGSNVWQGVTPDAAGTFAFEAAERFTLAMVHQFGTEFSTEFVFATPQDIEPLSGVSCVEQFGTKTLNGTVAGVPAGTAAMISMGGSFAYPVGPTTAYSLTDLPNGPVDLIAHREVVGVNTVTPERVIRRLEDRVNGTSIPVLDFNSNEAQNTVAHTFTTSGFSSAEDNYYLLTFNTATTRRHSLSTLVNFASAGAQTLYGIPSALTQAGDFHELEIFADAGSLYRGEVQFYRIPGARNVSLGANLNTPTLTTAGTSPHLRLRTQLPSQFEYGAFVTVSHVQDGREVVLTATNSYFNGTPITWDLTIPDMSNVTGFPTGALLQSGAGTDWFVEGYGGTGGLRAYFGSPTDGTTLHYAGRAFTTNARLLSRARGAEAPVRRRPRGIGAY